MNNVPVLPLKPPTTFDEQLNLYRSRGLIIKDEGSAIEVLKHYNYYRLRGYTLSLMEGDTFHEGTTFEELQHLYDFDAKLRILLMTIIEHIEISFRTHIAYLIAHKYGALGYKNSDNFSDKNFHDEILNKIEELISKSKELFVLHHKEKYDNNFPVWAAFEVLTFGLLSQLFKNLKTKDKKDIINTYYSSGFYYTHVENWLHSLTIIRNTCAHYSRIYNKKLTVRTKFLDKDACKYEINNNEIFSIIFNLKYLVSNNLWKSWTTNLEALIYQYDEVNLKLLGFPENWKEILSL